MKVGDLVKLSAYGKKRQWNDPIVTENPDVVGLIIKCHPNRVYGYTVQWPMQIIGQNPNHSRREIKYAY
tara:strand:+ start:101 stop:307 length:207 start_codon:yes stop_codon:yes gene_type:complete